MTLAQPSFISDLASISQHYLANTLIDARISTEKLRRVDPHFGQGWRFAAGVLAGSVSGSPQFPQALDSSTTNLLRLQRRNVSKTYIASEYNGEPDLWLVALGPIVGMSDLSPS